MKSRLESTMESSLQNLNEIEVYPRLPVAVRSAKNGCY